MSNSWNFIRGVQWLWRQGRLLTSLGLGFLVLEWIMVPMVAWTNTPNWRDWAIQSGQIRNTAVNNAPLTPQSQTLWLELDLTRRRVTLYQGQTIRKSYPVAVGKPGWETPVGNFIIKEMIRNPDWKNPFNGNVLRAGHPRNPLGRRWIGFWTDGEDWIGFHGTPDPQYIGQAVSHGCVRMNNQDIEELFESVAVGIPVKVVR